MNILRQGNKQLAEIELNKTRKFECFYCHCLWTAGKDEYKVGSKYNDDFYYMKCPCCGIITYTDDEKGKL